MPCVPSASCRRIPLDYVSLFVFGSDEQVESVRSRNQVALRNQAERI